MNRYLNRLVRSYLRWCPITEGKRPLLNLTQNRITPDTDIATFETKYRFRLKANLANPEHRYLYFYGTHDERYAVTQLRKIVKPGDTCWDIGANIGFYTCLFAEQVGTTGAVVAYEPALQTCRYLEENIALNRFRNTTVINEGLGNSAARRPLYYSAAALTEGTASLKYRNGRDASEQVTLSTIDTHLSELPVPDLIKIDVEGYQLEVLQGGERCLRTHAPLLMAELKDVGDTNQEDFNVLEAYIADLGYTLYEIRKRGLKRCLRIADGRSRNFILANTDAPNFQRLLPLF